jgi:hypothetical protein
MMGTYIQGPSLPTFAACYMTNAIRCWPRGADTGEALKACRPWLVEDVELLCRNYRRVGLVLCGSEAIAQVMGKETAIGSFPQGKLVKLGRRWVTLLATYLPAVLLPNRTPEKYIAIRDHLLLIRRWARTGQLHPPRRLPPTLRLVSAQLPGPPKGTQLVSLDIETYGAVEGHPRQRFFVPTHALALDGCPAEQLVQTVAMAWENPAAGGGISAKAYRVALRAERTRFVRDLQAVKGCALLSNNVQFDVSFLRAAFPELRPLLTQENYKLADLGILNFLQNDQRPERSLKTLAPLLGVDDYLAEPIDLRKGERYASVLDSRLVQYNVKDAVATLECWHTLLGLLNEQYGEGKIWNTTNETHYSDLLWLCLEMTHNGVAVDLPLLRSMHDRLERHMTKLSEWGLPRGLVMAGKGSDIGQRAIVTEIHDAVAPKGASAQRSFARQVAYTGTHRWVSTADPNLLFFRERLQAMTTLRRQLPGERAWASERIAMIDRLRRYRRLEKLLTSYVRPLLGRNKASLGSSAVAGLVHPKWFPVPSRWAEQSNQEGGQRQIRLSAKDPPIQTLPKLVRKCIRSRFP